MPRTLQFLRDGDELSVGLAKLDRARLYGRVERVARTRDGQLCKLGYLSSDGLQVQGACSWTIAPGARIP